MSGFASDSSGSRVSCSPCDDIIAGVGQFTFLAGPGKEWHLQAEVLAEAGDVAGGLDVV